MTSVLGTVTPQAPALFVPCFMLTGDIPSKRGASESQSETGNRSMRR